ncbi:MAG: putative exosortase-associated protein (TIGR04073 family) [Candidatus Binatia bacterium]|jgi:putative exosortase-associated protein (TIGR04073 family)
MRKSIAFLSLLATLALFSVGCSGPSYKLGRGLNNIAEPFRLGEFRRSIEQAHLWNSPRQAFRFGAIQGVNRTFVRAGIGLVEIVTFPFPSYEPFYLKKEYPSNGDVYIGGPYRTDQLWTLDFMSEDPRYPDSYSPGPFSDGIFATDTALGFASGDVFPGIIGSRFHIFDY